MARDRRRPLNPVILFLDMDAERFAFAFDPTYRRLSRPFGVTPESSWVVVDGGQLEARFGPWRVTTPLVNVSGAEVTGPYSLIKTAGSARLAITDRGLTFATNGHRGVRIDFRTPGQRVRPSAAHQAPRADGDRRGLRAARGAADLRRSLTIDLAGLTALLGDGSTWCTTPSSSR